LVLASPRTVGRALVASNKVTPTLASGSVATVPPVWTTPRRERALAEEVIEAVTVITARATAKRVEVKIDVLINRI
jgi:hypothetical protein